MTNTKWEPSKDEYGRPIWTPNDPPVYTADRKVITHGMRVFTNNLDRGVIDLTGTLGDPNFRRRAANYEWHGPEQRWVLWFDVVCDTNYKGEPSTERVMQSDDRVAARFQGRSA
jgi:hypothetical protein